MHKRMKLICCDVLFRMACRAAARSKNVIDIDFTLLQSHTYPDQLRDEIQGLIDKADAYGAYEAILLGYGLCGNSTAGLVARGLPLVIPRAHDCCTLFLGSREKFVECFGERLSAQWSSHGYLERNHEHKGGTDINKSLGLDKGYADLVEQYGEENAEYIWETLHPARSVGKEERIYIDVAPFDGPEDGDYHYKRYAAAVMAEAAQTATAAAPDVAGAQPEIQRLEGSTRLIDMLLDGDWNDEEFLIVPPGKSIAAVYDMEQVIAATTDAAPGAAKSATPV
ncbi:MAG: DUF1638 domain-containing protein [Oscillospiraceae bacterium]|nr:DUF1638 domain-containing protein [Oscillospiraceae bacterium]